MPNFLDPASKGFDRAENGTAIMLSAMLVLAGAGSIWFACNWYQKRHRKQKARENAAAAQKTRVKQTFSRFSQVDEELTMHQIDEHDEAILQAGLRQTQIETSRDAQLTSPVEPTNCHGNEAFDGTCTQNLDVSEIKQDSKPPYLETDL